MPRDALQAYLDRGRALAATVGEQEALGAVAAAIARAGGVDLKGVEAPLVAGDHPPLAPPAHLARPELLGTVYEALRSRGTRRATGAFFTPEAVARPIVAAVLGPLAATPAPRVGDPAVGGGAFLLAAARHLADGGADVRALTRAGLYGTDVDPLAVAVTRTALALLTGRAPPAEHVRVADALAGEALPSGLDAVVGNPPFLNQLSSTTARTAAQRAALRRRFGAAAGGYADAANLFLLLALRLVRDGGRVGLVLPAAFLAARDAGPARAAAASSGALEWLWLAGEDVFDAGVRVCAPVFAVGRPQRAVRRRVGPAFSRRPAAPRPDLGGGPWAGLVADLLGVPPVELGGHGTLAEHCTAGADFRDQYYGLVPHVFDDAEGVDDERGFPRLVTSGLVDPARSLWGVRQARFAKRAFARPRIDASALRADARLARWCDRRQVPKVVLATQTKVLEGAVDEAGTWLPCTPAITVEPRAGRLWHVAAALHAPALSAVALQRRAGSALGVDAIKLAARDVTDLPAPRPGVDWDAGARALRAAARATSDQAWRSALAEAGRALNRAYGVTGDDRLVAWWLGRLPPWRGA